MESNLPWIDSKEDPLYDQGRGQKFYQRHHCRHRIRVAVILLLSASLTIFYYALSCNYWQPHLDNHTSYARGSNNQVFQTSIATKEIKQSRVKKVTGLYGDGVWMNSSTPLDVTKSRLNQALFVHQRHADKHNHDQIILTHNLFGKVVNNAYTKIGNLLQHNLYELSKGDERKTEWLFWHDADTVILNRQVPLDIFVANATQDKNFIYTSDFNGLNGGVFFLRISEWTSLFLSTILAIARPIGTQSWDFWEQGAIKEVLKMKSFNDASIQFPKDWLNRYPYLEWNNTTSTFKNHVRPGTFMIHLAGPDKYEEGWFDYYLRLASSNDPSFHDVTEANILKDQVDAFWKEQRDKSSVSTHVS